MTPVTRIYRPRSYRKHWPLRSTHQVLGYAVEKDAANAGSAMGSHYDHVHVKLFRSLIYKFGRIASPG